MSYGANYGKYVDKKEVKRASTMSEVKRTKLTSIIREDKRIAIGENVRKVSQECSRHKELGNRKLRESVLNKLWDSLPPEIRNSPHKNDEDSDSTQSGLGDREVEGKDSDELSTEIEFSKDIRVSSVSTSKQIRNTTEVETIRNDRNFRSKSRPTDIEDSPISWETNLDFIQSIIWLKSATAKLQRVTADEFLEVFKNQWELSPKIKLTETISAKTKQLEKLNLIKNRLVAVANDNSERNNPDVVIPDSDDSRNPSLQSSQHAPDRDTANIRVSESTVISTVDSGFDSEKPESAEVINSSQCLVENADKSRKTKNFELTDVEMGRKNLQARNYEGLVFTEGCSSAGETNRVQIRKRILKRKYEAVSGTGSKTIKTISKRSRPSISSATLNYVLRSSECNKALVTSVQRILEALENAENRHDLVRKEAIDAVVTIVDLLDNEKGPNSCRNEVVAMVKRVLEMMLNSSDVDKLTIWEHHRLVVLELCNSFPVCKEVANYVISELKELISVANQTTEKNMRASLVVMDKSFVLFHSLKVVLKKYRSLAQRREINEEEKNASQKIPEVTDLWKRNWKPAEQEPDIFVTDLEILEIPDHPEELWTRILEELVVASTTVWPLVKILSWQCLAMLKSPVGSKTRDG